MKPIPVVDLFAGPGGLGEGFSRVLNGGKRVFRTVVSVEKDRFAHQTLSLRAFYRHFVDTKRDLPAEYYDLIKSNKGKERENTWAKLRKHPAWNQVKREALCLELGKNNRKIRRHISAALKGVNKWILIGGPPCQAYSLVGRSRMKNHDGMRADHRHFLYKEYLAIIRKYKPYVFVMENVKGLNTALVAGRPILPKIIADLKGAKYTLHSLVSEQPDVPEDKINYLIKSEEYGVPQTRHRVIIVGVRSDKNVRAIPTLKTAPQVSLKSVINTLPKLDGLDSSKKREDQLQKRLGGMYLPRVTRRRGMPHDLAAFIKPRVKKLANVVLNHEARSHMPADLKRYRWWAKRAKKLKRSPTIQEIPTRSRATLMPKHANIVAGSTKTFVDRFKVQLGHKPCGTITSHISKDGHYYIHYDPAQARSFSVREAARVQTFPDDYFFMGNRTQQYHQVGNAVPPYLAYQIGQAVAKVMGIKVRG